MLIKLNFIEGVKWAFAGLFGWAVSFVMPVAPFLGFVFALVLCDLYTGVQAAKKRKELIRSKGLRRSIKKVSLYCVGILLAHGMDVVFFIPKDLFFDLTWLVAGLIALTEFKSNLENIGEVTGADIWGKIAAKIPKIFKL